MNKLYLLTLQALCQTFDKQKESSIFKFFPSDVEGELAASRATYPLPLSYLNEEEALNSIHYSWLAPVIEKYPKEEIGFYLAALPVASSGALSQLIKPTPTTPTLTPIAKKFFLSRLYQDWLKENDFIPKEFLNSSPLKDLLLLSKLQLVTLIDFLGIQDLAIDLRKVLDKKVLEEISKKLTENQKRYLTTLLQRGDLPLIKSEDVGYWQKSSQVLGSQIHQKGLIRLAYALSKESENLVWHITHLLDIGRGKELMKHLKEKDIAGSPAKFKQQITSNIFSLMGLFKEGKK